MTALMLALTLGLGVWQMQRLSWKTDLILRIDEGERHAPVPLPAHPEAFSRYTAAGSFSADQAWYSAEVRQTAVGPVYGAHALALFRVPGREPFVVDRGWAPDSAPPPISVGPTTIEGYVRDPEHTPWGGAKDDSAKRRFYALDPLAIGASMGAAQVSPFTFVLIGPTGSIPEPVQGLPRPPNDHLSYAVTWFSLAGALIVVFIVYARQILTSKDSHDRL